MIELKIDARESDSRKEGAYQFFSFKSYDVSVKQLPVADFVFDDKVVFEWKEPNDFIKSVMDGRVFRQSKKMQQYPFHFVIIVGSVPDEIRSRYSDYENPFYSKYRYGKVKGFTLKNYLGALASLFVNDKVIIVENESQAFTLMDFLVRQILEFNADVKSVDKPVTKMTDSVATFLACIDTISIKKAVLIRESLKLESLRDLLEVSYEDLTGIKGIGAKTARKIIEEID